MSHGLAVGAHIAGVFVGFVSPRGGYQDVDLLKAGKLMADIFSDGRLEPKAVHRRHGKRPLAVAPGARQAISIMVFDAING